MRCGRVWLVFFWALVVRELGRHFHTVRQDLAPAVPLSAGRAGRTIFPLELLLGIQQGVTPAAASRIGKQFATCGSSRGRTLEVVADQMGTKIGTGKLRRLIATLAGVMELLGQEAQVEKLIVLIKNAREGGETAVLSVSRDGVALGLAPWSFFEMASVDCVSVLAGGKKLGTVYLGRVPETNQLTLSNQLTDLLKATIRRCGDHVPEIVYVSDAGKVETAYWRNTLSKFFVDGRRIKITRVVESACKQIVSERMKLSGMRWKKEGGQQTMTLRCLLLSGVWESVYENWLVSKPNVDDLINLESA